MSSHKTHDNVNTFCALSLLGFGIITRSSDTIYTAVGLGIGTIWLSPDLDLEQSYPSKRFGPLKLLLKPYRMLCGHHRSWVSHTPILSSLIRVLYCLSPLVIYSIFTQDDLWLVKLIYSPSFFWVLIGLEIATDLHLFLDFQYSYFKKIRRI